MGRHILVLEPATTRRAKLRRWLNELGFTPLRLSLDDLPPLAAHPELILLAGPEEDCRTTCLALKRCFATGTLPIVQLVGCPSTLHAEPDAVLAHLSRQALAGTIRTALLTCEERRQAGVLADLRLCLPSDVREQERLAELLPPWFVDCGLPAHSAQHLNYAVGELVGNAIEWGHRYDRARLVRVWCQRDAEKISVLVTDSGPGFDRHNLPHAARPGDPISHRQVRSALALREGGFGIQTAGELVDFLCYNDTGNEGLLIKYLPHSSQTVPLLASSAP